jgi:hypothetical protein
MSGFFCSKELSSFEWEQNESPAQGPSPASEQRGKGFLIRWVAAEFKHIVNEAERLQHAWFALRQEAVARSRAERHLLGQLLDSLRQLSTESVTQYMTLF